MKQWIPDMISVLLILLFVYTSMSKLFNFGHFKLQRGSSPWLASYAGMIAWQILAAELVVAAMLSVKSLRLTGLYASLSLLSVFTIYIAIMLLTQEHLPCSCGGAISQLTWSQHLAFNFFLMILSGLGIVAERRSKRKLLIPSGAGN